MKYSDICLRKHALISIYRNTVQCGRCCRGRGERFIKTELRRERKARRQTGRQIVGKGNRDEGWRGVRALAGPDKTVLINMTNYAFGNSSSQGHFSQRETQYQTSDSIRSEFQS